MSENNNTDKDITEKSIDAPVKKKISKSSEALNMINKKPVKKSKGKKRSFKEKAISFMTNFDNFKIILLFLIIGSVLIVAGIHIQIGKIEDSNSILVGTIVRSALIAIGSGVIVAGILKQRRRW